MNFLGGVQREPLVVGTALSLLIGYMTKTALTARKRMWLYR